MRKNRKHGQPKPCAADPGIFFEPLEPRLLLSGSWGPGAEAPSADSPATPQDSFTRDAAPIAEAAGAFNAESLAQDQRTPGSGTLVDLLSRAPALNVWGAADPKAEKALTPEQSPSAADSPLTTSAPEASGDATDSEPQSDTMDTATRRELVLVNANVADYEKLIADMNREAEERILEVVVLDADQDGIMQLSQILAERSDLSAVHVITHGADGQINLGNTWLSSDNLDQYSDSLAAWSSSLDPDADILIYGSNLAASQGGQTLIDNLSSLTGADVAASDDMTGDPNAGGDWALEYQTGQVESAVIGEAVVLKNWTGTLDAAQVAAEYLTSPLAFEQNVGQADTEIDFLARGSGYSVYLSDADAVIALEGDDGGHVVRLNVVGASSDPAATGEDLLESRSNYLIGDQSEWLTGISNYGAVSYDQVYEGIGLRYYGNQRQLEYDFIVQACADPTDIRLNFDGILNAEIAANGTLLLTLNEQGDQISFQAPIAYQDGPGGRIDVTSKYIIHEDGTIGFDVGAYDTQRELVIDPILSWTSYFGGTGTDSAKDIAVDASGNVYIAGDSTVATNLPTTAGPLGPTGAQDAYVAKFSNEGSTLLSATYYGGSAMDTASAITVDDAGNVYVAGTTGSSDFPTVNAADTSLAGSTDAYVVKLNAAGTSITYGSYLGGSGTNGETVAGIALDPSGSGRVVVGGYTDSSNLPTKNAYDATLGGGYDGFLAAYDTTQTGANSLLYSTYFGGSNGGGGTGNDSIYGLAVDGSGNIYLTGHTSATSEFPITANAYDSSAPVNNDAYLAKLKWNGGASWSTLYASYIGSETVGASESGEAIAYDAAGNIYVAGKVSSGTFPTKNAYDATINGGTDLFIAKFDPNAATGTDSLVYSTFYGGSGTDSVDDIEVDDAGNVYATGSTSSSNLPLTGDAHDSVLDGSSDAFLLTLDPSGGTLSYSTYLGGDGSETGYGLALDGDNNIYIAGSTGSTTGLATGGAYDTSNNGGTDGFVAKLLANQPPTATANSYTVAEGGTLNGNVITDNTGAGVDSDPDGDTLTATVVDGPLHGSLVLNPDGSFTYTPYDEPASNFADGDSFTYQLSDGKGGTDNATVTITVTPDATNEAPVNSVPGAQSVDQDSSLVFSEANGNRILLRDDAGGNAIELTLTATNGTITLAGTAGLTVTGGANGSSTVTVQGSLTDLNNALNGLAFAPTAGYFGSASLQVTTNDLGQSGSGVPESDTDVISITVNEVNYAPVITSNGGGAAASINVDENTTAVTTVTATDANSADTLSYAISGTDAALFDINSSTGELTFKDLPDYENPLDANTDNNYQVTVTAADGNGGSDSQAITVTVTQVGDTGTAVFSDDSTTPQTSDWDGSSFGTTSGTASLLDNYRTVQGADAPTRDEKIVVGIDASGNTALLRWDGSSWSGIQLAGTVSETYWYGAEVAYEQLSGDAVVVWNDNTQAAGNKLRYAVWDGTSWSAPQSITAYTGAEPQNLRLAFDPGSDAMVLVVDDVNADDFALVWDGDSWGNAITLDTTGTLESDQSAIAVSFEAQSGHALVTYGINGSADVYYRIWEGSSWSAEASVTAPVGVTGDAAWLATATDYTSDRIALAAMSTNGEVWLSVWEGIAWETPVLAETGSTGTIYPNMAVAFESTTGEALATYGQSGQSDFKYRIWDSTSGWSGEFSGPSIGATSNTMTLDSGPASDHIMLSIQDSSSDVNYLRWDGSGWSIDNELTTTSGETKNQPFVFIYDQDGLLVDPNAAPVNTVPATQNTAIDTQLVFSTANGNLISVADADDASLEVTLNSTNGTLTLNGTAGLSFSLGDGSADTDMTFTGTVADINAALDGMQFDPTAAFEGFAGVQIATTDFAGGGAGGVKSDTDAVTIEVGDVNTAPVNTVPAAQTIDMNGMVVFSSATGTAISVSDVDAGGAAIQVTLSATNGTLNLSGTSGLIFTTGNGSADTNMTFTGTVTDINAALEGMTFVADADFTGTAGVQITTDDLGSSGAGGALSDSDTVSITVQAVKTSFWLSTSDDVSSPGAVGLDSWTAGQVLEFSETGGTLTFEPGTTTGTFSLAAFDLDSAAFSDTDTKLDGIHYVTRDLPAGGIMLQQGDVLFSTQANETIDGVSYEAGDIILFRPTTAGDYSAGTFSLFFDKTDSSIDVKGFTLVESAVMVGDTQLNTGDLLILEGNKDILRLVPTQLGDTTSGTESILIDGDGGLGLGKNIIAIGLVEHTSVIGDKTLQAGTLILAVDGEETDGTPLNVTRWDLFTLDVSTTGDGTTTGTAELLLEGADVQLDDNKEAITGVSLFPNQAPAVDGQTFAVAENSATGTVVGSVTASDPENGTLTYAITGGNTDGAFVIDANTGQITVANSAALNFETTPSFTLTVAAIDPDGAYGNAVITVNLNNLDEAGVNDAPVNTIPADQTIERDGMLLFSSATGTGISVSDFDAGSGLLEVTLDATNGTLNLSGIQGLLFSTGDGTADDMMTFTGTVADINAALEGMTFVADADFTGTAGVQITTNDQGNTGTGGALSDTDSVAITIQAADQKLWLTFENDQAGTGNSDIPNITAGDVVTFSDITQLETSNSVPLASTTSGTLAYGFNLDTVLLSGGGQASDGNTIVNAVHYVTRDIQVGSNNIQLQAGDILLSTDGDEDIDGITHNNDDVFVFRPDTAGDYSQGSFFLLIDGNAASLNLNNITGISLVEQTTSVGGVTLNAGEFLFAHDGSGRNILHYVPGTLGATTTGTASVLVAGADINIGQSIGGLHLVQNDTVIGDESLTAGQLLVSLQGNDSTVGSGTTIDVLRQDIFVLNVTATGTGTSAATASRLFEGLDESLDNNNESIWGIGYQGNAAPTINDETFALDENSANGTVVGSVTATDPELGALQYAIIAGNTDGAFAIDATSGQITVANSAALDFATNPSFSLTAAAIDPQGAYDSATITVNLNNVNEAPVNTVPGAQTTAQDTPIEFSSTNGNAITVSDTDAGANEVAVTLTVTNGTLTLDWPNGGTASAIGGETPSNATVTGAQLYDINSPQTVAMAEDGRYVVVWSGNGPGDADGVFFRRFDATGTALGGETLVNIGSTTGVQSAPAIGIDGDGKFVITWQSDDGAGQGIFARRFDASGNPLGEEVAVNNETAKEQLEPSIAVARDGRFVISWSGEEATGTRHDAFARIFDSSGTPQGLQFQVNGYTSQNQGHTSVAIDDAGNFVIAWGGNSAGDSGGISARGFDAIGTETVAEFQVNTTTSDQQYRPSIAMDSAGNFVISWMSWNQDAPGAGIYARGFDANGTETMAEFPVNQTTANSQQYPSVAMDADGDFVITWMADAQDGDAVGVWNVYARQYANDGTAKTGETLVNSATTAGDQLRASVDMNDHGDFAVSWTGSGAGDTDGVFTQSFAVPTGLTYTAGDGVKDTTTTFTGTIADINAALDGLVFTPDAGFNGTATLTITTDDLGNSGPGGALQDTDTVDITVGVVNALWISPDENSSGGADGLPGGWKEGEVLQFGGPDLTLGPATDGDFASVIDFDTFTTNASDPGALHFVSRDLTIGSGANQFDLQIGDILVSFNQDETIRAAYHESGTDTLVGMKDLLVFRPDTPGSYTSGIFHMLLQGVPDPTGTPVTSLHAISLVEQDTYVGNTLLAAGTFLFAEQDGTSPNTPNHVYHFAPTAAGPVAAAGISQILINGDEINIEVGSNIRGLDLIEKPTTIGGMTFNSGDILVTLRADDSAVGDAPTLDTSTSDIFVLKVTRSALEPGGTVATAEMVLDGSDVNFSGSERVYAISVVPGNYGPAVGGDATGSVTEDVGVAAGNISDSGALTIADPDAGESSFTAVTVAGTYGNLNIDAAGAWTYTADNSQAAIQGLNAGETLNDVFMVTTADGTTQQVTITINGAADNPVATDDTYSVDEDNTLTVGWWDTDWTRRQEITLDNQAQSETLTDFPVLIVLNSGNIDYTQTRDDGSDLRFFAADGTPLVHEIEQWNEGGDSAVWVRVPQITGGSTSDSIWMYYGNASAVSNQTAGSVWDGNFVGVWHLNEEQTGTSKTGVYQDVTTLGNDGVDRVAASGQDGQITDGQEFGTNDWIEIAHDPSLDLRDSMTISFWIKPTADSDTFNRVVEKGLWGYNDSYYFGGGDGTNDLTFYLNGQEVFDTADDVLTVGVWQHAAVSYTSNGDGTGSARLYLNGAEIATGNYTNGPVSGNTGRLGIGHSDPLYDFDGFIDEVQISNTDRSADWIAAQYQATSNQFGSEFVSFGGEESAPADAGVAANDSDADGEPLTVTLVSGPTHADSFTLRRDGTFDYTPVADYAGSDSFVYELNDGHGNTAQATATITINALNDAPVITSAAAVNAAENQTAVTTVTATDADGDTPSFTITGGADQGLFSITAGGVLTFDTPRDFETFTDADTDGVYEVEVTANDGNTGTDVQTILVTVTNVNEAPTLVTLSASTVDENTDTSGGYTVGSLTTTDPDSGDTTSYSINGGADAAVFAISGSNLILTDGLLDFETQASYEVTVRITDSGGLTHDQTFTITVNDLNEAPSFDSAAVTGATEDLAYSYTITTSDVDGDGLTITAPTRPAWLTLTDNGDGTATLTGTPTNAHVGDHAVVLEVTDGSLTDTQSFTITVGNTNDAPVITSAAAVNAAENQTAVTTVTATDADGDPPSFTITGGADQALFSITAGGVLTFDTPRDFETFTDADTDGVYEVEVTANDGNTGTDVQTILVTVTNVNEAPTLVTLSASTVDENTDTSGGYTVGSLTTTDPDSGDTTSYSINGGADAAVFAISGSNLILTDGTLDFETQASYEVTVRITDSGGLTHDQTFTITVNDLNEAPSFDSAAVTGGTQDVLYSYAITTSDVDGDGLTITAPTRPAWLTLTDNGDGTATLTGTPTNAHVGDHAVVLEVTDGSLTDTQSFTITVGNTNDAPVITSPAAVNAAENQTAVTTVTATDADGDTPSFTITGGADQALFSITAGGVLTFDTPRDFETFTDADTDGVYEVEVTANDGNTGTDVQTILVTVTNVNEAPTLVTLSASTVDENTDTSGGYTVGSLTTTDPDSGDTTSYSINGGADAAVFAISGSNLILTDGTLDFETQASYEVTVRITDSGGLTHDQTFTITVNDLNEAPSFDSAAVTGGTQDVLYSYAITTSDVDGDGLTITAPTRPAWLTLTDNGDGTATLTGTPTNAHVGDHAVVLEVTDGSLTDTQSFTITVGNTNDAPVITSAAAVNAAENQTAVTTVTATDADGDTPSFTITGGADQALFSITAGGVLTFDTAQDFETFADFNTDGVYEVEVTANDGNTGTDVQTILVTVTNVNEAPTLVTLSASTVDENTDTSGGYTVGSLTTTDPDSGDTTSYSINGGADAAVFAISGSNLILTDGTLDFETQASYEVTVRITDSGGLTHDQTFTITVNDLNESAVGPVTDNDGTANTVAEDAGIGSTVSITSLATDPDAGDTVTYSLSDDAGGLFAIDSNTGVITVANALDYETATSHSVTVLATSSDTSTSSQAFTINVTDINESVVGPVTDSNAAANTVAEDAGIGDAVGITALATDADGTDTVTYSLSDDAGGLFAINANTGVITVANALNYESATSHSVTVLATSSDTSTSSQAFTINVTDINESAVGPVSDSNATANTVAENASIGDAVGITSLATDADGTDTVTYSLSDDAGGLFTIDANTGVITVANALDYETATSHSVTVLATSSDTSTSSQAFTINVTNINESAVGPVTDNDATANTVAEDAGIGSTVGITAFATDADGTDTVTYSLSDDAGGLFAIDSNTGVITVANALDYENATSHSVTVLATSSDTSTSSQAFTINVTDINESAVGPVSDNDATANTVAEDASVGDAVGITALATDADGTDTVTYSLSDDAGGLFAIDANTGVITVANALDYETATSHSVTVLATSSDASTSSQAFTINVTDINESAGDNNDPPPTVGGGNDPGPDDDDDPIEPDPVPEPELEPLPEPILKEILPVENETPSPQNTGSPATRPSKGPEPTTLHGNFPRYTVPTIASTTALPSEAPAEASSVFHYVRQQLTTRLQAQFTPVATVFFSSEAMTQELDHIQQQIDEFLELESDQGKLIIGTAASLGASVFVGYVIWAFRGAGLLFGALSAMPMWRCFDPLPVLLGDEKKRNRDGGDTQSEPELEDDERHIRNLLDTASEEKGQP